MDNVSLICEEDLLTTIFCACDLERTGKVAVSKIVDYLRHTTSGGLEDAGLEELCNMLDPDQQDVSMDLETFHSIMQEWIEDCKRKWEDGATVGPTANVEDLEFKVHKTASEAKELYVQMNFTSGSLEAFGGDVSKGDIDNSDLINCIADLQYKNQKLHEENNKLKLTLEAADETNNKLQSDNEDLRQQIKSIQHSVLKGKSLEEELEETKANLHLSEEKRQQILCQNKQLEKENQSLIIKIASLQEENIRNSMDTDGLKEKNLELSKNAEVFQIQAHMYESALMNKEANLIQKEQAIKELKVTVVEFSSIIETLRADKKQLEETMQHMQQELILNGLNFPSLSELHSDIPEETNSLHHELELAQSPEIAKTEWASLDETLNHEMLFLLQEPEHAREKFKTIMQKLQEEAYETEELVMTSLQWVIDSNVNMQQTLERKIAVLKQEFEEKRCLWIQKLNLLEKYKESLEKGFIRMASNLRRSKTEQFQLRKELSDRQREIETIKQLEEETAAQAESLGLELQKTTKQLEDASKQLEDQVEAFHCAYEEVESLKHKLEEAISEQKKLKDENAALTSTCQLLQEKVEDQKMTANALRWELLQRRLFELLCQCYAELKSDYSLLPTSAELGKGKIDCGEPMLPASLIPSSVHLISPQESLTSSLESIAPLAGCLAMEEQSPECSREAEEDVPTSAAMENNTKDPPSPVPDESMNKKLPNTFKPALALRRVSLAALPWSTGSMTIGLPLAQLHEPDGGEWSNKFIRRSSFRGRLGAKQHEKRPSLQRFMSMYAWAEYEDKHSQTKNGQSESPAEVQEPPFRKTSVSGKGKCSSSKWSLESVYNLMSSQVAYFKTSFSNANKSFWVSVSILVLLAALTSFLTGLCLQRPAATAPVGTGDCWTLLQQLLWPYVGLQHYGRPPV